MNITIKEGFIHFDAAPGSELDQDSLKKLLELRDMFATKAGCMWDFDTLTNYRAPQTEFRNPGRIEIGSIISSYKPYEISFWPKDAAAEEIIQFLIRTVSAVYVVRKRADYNSTYAWVFRCRCKERIPLRLIADELYIGEPPRLNATFYSPGCPVS